MNWAPARAPGPVTNSSGSRFLAKQLGEVGDTTGLEWLRVAQPSTGCLSPGRERAPAVIGSGQTRAGRCAHVDLSTSLGFNEILGSAGHGQAADQGSWAAMVVPLKIRQGFLSSLAVAL